MLFYVEMRCLGEFFKLTYTTSDFVVSLLSHNTIFKYLDKTLGKYLDRYGFLDKTKPVYITRHYYRPGEISILDIDYVLLLTFQPFSIFGNILKK